MAFPPALAGEAQAHLAGDTQVVALEGTVLSLGAAGELLSNHGAGILSNHAAGLVSNHGGGLISDAGGAYRLKQGPPEGLVMAPDDPRLALWEQWLYLDLCDQMLQAFALAGPKLGAWVAFPFHPKMMPAPSGGPAFQGFLAAAYEGIQALPLAGRLEARPGGLHLWLLRLPKAGAPWAEGVSLVEVDGQVGQGAWAKCRVFDEALSFKGLSSAAFRVDHLPEGGLRFRGGEVSLPWAEMTEQAKLFAHDRMPLVRRRQGWVHALSTEGAELRLAETMGLATGPLGQAGPWELRQVQAFGFAMPGRQDPGLAHWSREGEGPLGQVGLWRWMSLGTPVEGTSRVAAWYLPSGQAAPPPLEAKLEALTPPWRTEDDLLAPTLPPGPEGQVLDPALMPELPAALILKGP